MKRLLTYGLLLLTILASHFVVSACQDDLPETTDIMVTFTTRAISGGAASTAPEIEQMHDLRVIMLRSDGTIVGKGQYTPEGDFNPSSVRFTFSTTIPNPEGEDFTFLAIANEKYVEEYVDEELPWSTRGIGDKLTQSEIESITVDIDIKSNPIPQTDYWTVRVPQSNYTVKDRTLQFAGSKISVVFNNQTEETQSLSDIRITGIGSASAGYLFKQTTGDDFVGERHADTDITFTDVTNLAAGDTSEELTYYTYPVGSVSSPTLFATWNEKEYNLPITEVRDEEGNVHSFTFLARNERLKIVITLTPAGDITVNYEIAEWIDNPTNIGDTAPTIPGNDDGNGYNTEDWTAGNDIEIGGGGGFNDAPTFVPEGTVAIFDWTKVQTGENNWKTLSSILPNGITLNDVVAVGNVVAIEFTSKSPNEQGNLYFVTGHHNANNPHYLTTEPYSFTGESTFIVHFAFSENMNGFTIQNVRDQDLVITNTPNILISKLGVFKPNS